MEENVNLCEAQLSAWLQVLFQQAFGEAVAGFSPRVQPAQDAKFGDFQCNDAMPLAKTLHLPPRQIAQRVLDGVTLPPMLAKVEIAGPGFINLTVNPVWLAEQLEKLAAAPSFGIPQCGAGKSVVIDYSSPNAAKQMHIGHIRSIVIGNAIDRLHRALGYRVIADNHLGDWGTQFGILIKGYRECLTEEQRQNLTVADLEAAYVASSTRGKTDEAWKDACRQELVKLQQGDSEDRALWQRFIEITIEEFTRMYKRLDVQFDLWRGESYYNDRLPGVVKELQDKGLAEESEGAQIVRFEEEGLPVAIVQKSDGGFNYATSDIATVESRVEEFNPDRIIYVTDERQQLHFKQFFAICRKLGCTTKLVHVWFGLMSYQGKAISTREGNLIKLDDLLAEAVKRSLEIIRSQNPEGMTEAEQLALAEDIGIGAIKYTDLSHDPTTAIDFSWDKALALDGNSGPYLQYAHARICSLLDKAGESPSAGSLKLDTEIEKSLALALMQFPGVVRKAADNFKPSILADYLFGLSQTYSSFYQRSPVLKSEAETRASRLRLCSLVAEVLSAGLRLLGIHAPRRI
ncbi:MAG: arginine--tRNA ligase [Kiritimatiellae bacterium]|nr:arginine--tRNA ligase [Kiritimatiellia bacterium]